MFDLALEPVRALARAALRPATYPAQLREARAAALYAALWPSGIADRGVAALARCAGDGDGEGGCGVRTPVLLVHGYGANRSNWRYLERALAGAGFGHVHALNYNPLASDIPALGAACARRARQLMDHFGSDRVHLIGHSLGGVVARHAVHVDGLVEAATCATISSPHHGTPVARLGAGVTARQLRPGSPVLRRLAACARPTPTRFVAYYSNVDVLVPARSAQLLEPVFAARNVLIKDTGHLSILCSAHLIASVVSELTEVEGATAATAVADGRGVAVAA